MINNIANIITALGTLGLSIVAWFALFTWRKEFIGKKKIELARDIVRAACEVQDLLIFARLARFSSNDLKDVEHFMMTEKAREPQMTDIYPDRFHFMVSHYRMNTGQDKIDKLREFYNESFLYWDKHIMQLMYELIGYTLKVREASRALYYNDHPERHHEFMQTISSEDLNDPISKRAGAIIEELKLNLEPLYKDKRVKWKKLGHDKQKNKNRFVSYIMTKISGKKPH